WLRSQADREQVGPAQGADAVGRVIELDEAAPPAQAQGGAGRLVHVADDVPGSQEEDLERGPFRGAAQGGGFAVIGLKVGIEIQGQGPGFAQGITTSGPQLDWMRSSSAIQT